MALSFEDAFDKILRSVAGGVKTVAAIEGTGWTEEGFYNRLAERPDFQKVLDRVKAKTADRVMTELAEGFHAMEVHGEVLKAFKSLPDYAPWTTEKVTTTQKLAYASNAEVLLLEGGVRGGKSIAACNIARKLLKRIDGNRAAFIKDTMPEVRGSTMKTLFGGGVEQPVISADMIALDRSNNPTEPMVRLINGSEIFFGSATDIGKFGGRQYGLVVIEDVFKPDRGQRGQIAQKDFEYMRHRMSLPLPGGRKPTTILTTNPPPPGHWLEKSFPLDMPLNPGWERILFRTDDNRDNLRPGFIEDLELTMGREWVRRYLMGERVYSPDGPKVFQDFQTELGGTHIQPIEPIKDKQLCVCWDFGRYPAVTVHQFDAGHPPYWRILWERQGRLVYLEDFLPIVMADLNQTYPGLKFVHYCDSAGKAKRSSAVMDSAGKRLASDIDVMQSFGINPLYRHVFSEAHGIGIVQRFISRTGWMVIHPQCQIAIEGFSGGLQWDTDSNGQVVNSTRSDGWIEHVMDTIRIFAENVLEPGDNRGRTFQIPEPVYGARGTFLPDTPGQAPYETGIPDTWWNP